MKSPRPVFVVLPVKEIAAAKQRLAAALSPELRQAFVLAMLGDVLAALHAAPSLAGIIVVTVDPAAARLAQDYGAQISTDAARDGHTGAVTAAARSLARRGAAMLTIPGDVPLVAAGDIEALIAAMREGQAFTIVPARDHRGSNAVLCAPADAVPLRFGENSYFPHLDAARACGFAPLSLSLPRLALDIDRPDDLTALLALPQTTRAQAVLVDHGFVAPSVEPQSSNA